MGGHHSKVYQLQSPEEYKLILEDYKIFVSKYCKISEDKYTVMNEFVAAFSTYLAITEKYEDPTESVIGFIYGDPYSKNAILNSKNMIRLINHVDLSYGHYSDCVDMRYIIGLHLCKFPRP